MTQPEDLTGKSIVTIVKQDQNGYPANRYLLTFDDGSIMTASIDGVLNLDEQQAAIDAQIAAVQAELDALTGQQTNMNKIISDRASKTTFPIP